MTVKTWCRSYGDYDGKDAIWKCMDCMLQSTNGKKRKWLVLANIFMAQMEYDDVKFGQKRSSTKFKIPAFQLIWSYWVRNCPNELRITLIFVKRIQTSSFSTL